MPCAQVVEKQCILYQLIFIKDMVCLFESVENGVRFFTRQTMMEIYVYSKKIPQFISKVFSTQIKQYLRQAKSIYLGTVYRAIV